MILQTKPVLVDPLLLLMHEPNDWAYHPFDEACLAFAINKSLEVELSASGPFSSIVFVAPSGTGLSRWRLEWERWGKDPETYVADRGVTTVTGLRAGIPADVLEVIHRLSRRTLEVVHPNARLHRKGKS